MMMDSLLWQEMTAKTPGGVWGQNLGQWAPGSAKHTDVEKASWNGHSKGLSMPVSNKV